MDKRYVDNVSIYISNHLLDENKKRNFMILLLICKKS